MYRLNSKDFLNFRASEKMKVNDYLKERGVSSRLIIKSVKDGNIYLNGKLIRKNKKLKINDIISLKFEDEEPNGKVQKRPLDILYEDDDLLVINKEPLMVTHTAKDDSQGTLLNYILGYFEENNIKRKVRFINSVVGLQI